MNTDSIIALLFSVYCMYFLAAFLVLLKEHNLIFRRKGDCKVALLYYVVYGCKSLAIAIVWPLFIGWRLYKYIRG